MHAAGRLYHLLCVLATYCCSRYRGRYLGTEVLPLLIYSSSAPSTRPLSILRLEVRCQSTVYQKPDGPIRYIYAEMLLLKVVLLFLLLLVRDSYEQQHREVLIVGDSLVQVPSAMFNITNMLKLELLKVRHDFDITVRMNALPSLKVAALYEFVENKLATRVKTGEPTPDVILIYSDTDMSDGGWDGKHILRLI